MGAEITVDYSHDKDVSSTKNGGGGAASVSPESPLRSRRALPTIGSLSVGAANDDMLHGRAGIVYINGTKMPQDGWYQRVSEEFFTLQKICGLFETPGDFHSTSVFSLLSPPIKPPSSFETYKWNERLNGETILEILDLNA
jgi:hypothetical protein